MRRLKTFTKEETEFIETYVKTNSLQLTVNYLSLPIEKAILMHRDTKISNEIIRLKNKLNENIFNKQILTYENLSSYLSALIRDVNIPDADKASTSEKIQASKLLIEIHKLREQWNEKPEIVEYEELLENNINNLSFKEVSKLINKLKKNENQVTEPYVLTKAKGEEFIQNEQKSQQLFLLGKEK